MPLPEAEMRVLMRAEHGDPFAMLGLHQEGAGKCVRALPTLATLMWVLA